MITLGACIPVTVGLHEGCSTRGARSGSIFKIWLFLSNVFHPEAKILREFHADQNFQSFWGEQAFLEDHEWDSLISHTRAYTYKVDCTVWRWHPARKEFRIQFPKSSNSVAVRSISIFLLPKSMVKSSQTCVHGAKTHKHFGDNYHSRSLWSLWHRKEACITSLSWQLYIVEVSVLRSRFAPEPVPVVCDGAYEFSSIAQGVQWSKFC